MTEEIKEVADEAQPAATEQQTFAQAVEGQATLAGGGIDAAVDSPASPAAQAAPGGMATPATGPSTAATSIANATTQLTPLFMCDARFKTLERKFVVEVQKRFIKLYEKSADRKQRVLPYEFTAWLAGFIVHQCRSLALSFGDKGWERPETAFLEIFNALTESNDMREKMRTAALVSAAGAADRPTTNPAPAVPAPAQEDNVAPEPLGVSVSAASSDPTPV